MKQEIPKLSDFNHFAWNTVFKNEQYGLLTLSKIQGNAISFPDRYLPPTYAVQFVVRGGTTGIVNNKPVKLEPNDAFFIFADHIHEHVEVSPDFELYIMGFDSRLTDSLNIQISQSQLAYIFMHPVWHLTEHQMSVVLQYFSMLRVLMEENNPKAVTNMVRSFFYYLAEYSEVNPQQTHSLTRAEQICGQFLSLVELHCREHHSVQWYAGQLCLAAKYLSNVLKQTINLSPNACIDHAIARQAKSLLSSTSLSIQQISDRLGFMNQSHFGTFFRRHTSHSPKEYRMMF